MTARFPWYDAWWLNSYVAVRHLLHTKYADREAEFVSAFEPLRAKPGFKAVELADVLDFQALEDIRTIIADLGSDDLENHEFLKFGRHVVHNHPYLGLLQERIKPLVAEHAGEAVESSYNFLSLYNNLGICELHLDAPDAKWTLDICIDQSTPWPIQISEVCDWPEHLDCSTGWQQRLLADPQFHFNEFRHAIGSGLLFSGANQFHYRDRISSNGREKNFSHLVFFHFIPVGAGILTNTDKWPDYFGIPEIADVIIRPRSSPPMLLPAASERSAT